MRRVIFGVVFLISSTALAQSAQEKAAAEALFNDARKALDAGNLAEACPKFASSEKIDPAIGTALFLGECYERTNKSASAWAMFREAQDLAQKRGDKRAELAKQRADKLVPSRLTVALAADASVPGLEVERDGVVVSTSLLGFATPLDGGSHTIRATAPGKKTFEQTVQLENQKANVTVTIPKLEDVSAATRTPVPTPTLTPTPNVTPNVTPTPDLTPDLTPTPVATNPGNGQRIGGIVLIGAGVAGVAIGSIFGVMAGSDWHASNTDGKCDANSTRCFDPSGPGLRQSAQTEALVSTLGFVIGGVAIAGGVVALFTAPKAHAALAKTGWRLTPGLGGVRLDATF